MHTVDNAAVRESFASEIYEMGVQKAIKAVLDTPILSEDGKLTEESGQIFAPTQKVIDRYA